mmetsp:Transcript_61959/g.73436  ORF Transcript_61959/g.73436 Transcript_61959/m.73436 type:complete len:240 (-) Transcript_61959:1736-2455(-)
MLSSPLRIMLFTGFPPTRTLTLMAPLFCLSSERNVGVSFNSCLLLPLFEIRTFLLIKIFESAASITPKLSDGWLSSREYAHIVVAIALSTLSMPAPIRDIAADAPVASLVVSLLAVFINRDLTFNGVQLGHDCLIKAAAPATIGAAPDVPLKLRSLSPDPATADKDCPGAPISGLILLNDISGPLADDLATSLLGSLILLDGSIITVMLPVLLDDCASAYSCLILAASAALIMYPGILG